MAAQLGPTSRGVGILHSSTLQDSDETTSDPVNVGSTDGDGTTLAAAPSSATASVTDEVLSISGTGTRTGNTVLTESVVVSGIASDIKSGTINITDTDGHTASHTLTAGEISTASSTGTVTITSWTNLVTLKATDTLTATVSITDLTNNVATGSHTVTDPAGSAGAPINLGLSAPSIDGAAPVNVHITDVPSGWTINSATQQADGSWTLQTNDVQALTVATPADFAGASVLQVNETWTNLDGSTGSARAEFVSTSKLTRLAHRSSPLPATTT